MKHVSSPSLAVEELLLGANHNEMLAKTKKEKWLQTAHWDKPVIERLLHAMLTWDYINDRDNYRLILLRILIRIVHDYLWTTGQHAMASEEDLTLSSPTGAIADAKFHEMLNNELVCLIGFIDILTKNAKTNRNNEPHRPVLF